MGKGRKRAKWMWMRMVSVLVVMSMLVSSVYVPAYAQEIDAAEINNQESDDYVNDDDAGDDFLEDFDDDIFEEEVVTEEALEEDIIEAEEIVSEEAEAASTKKAKLYVTPSISKYLISGYDFVEIPFIFRNDGTETIDGITIKSFVSNTGITLNGVETKPHFYYQILDKWGFPANYRMPVCEEGKIDIYLEPGEEISGKLYIPDDLQEPYFEGTSINSTITFSGTNFEDCTTTINLNVYNPEKPEIAFGECKYINTGAFGYYLYGHDINRIDIGTVEIGTDDFTTQEASNRKFAIKNISGIKDVYTDDYPVVEMQYEIIGADAGAFGIYTGGPWAKTIRLKKDDGQFEFAIKVNSAQLMPGTYNAMLHFYQVLPRNTICNNSLSNGDIYIPLTLRVEGGSNYCRISEAVTGLKVEAGNTYNYISWDPAGGQDQLYYVERMSEDLGYYSRMDNDGLIGRTFIYDYDIENGIKVTYRVCTRSDDEAGGGNGIWIWSEPVSATPTGEGVSRLMPVDLDSIDDYIDGDRRGAHIRWTLYDYFDNGDGKDRYADFGTKKMLIGKNTSVDYFYIVMDGKKLVDEHGDLIKIRQDSYAVGSEWYWVDEENATYVDTYSWSYDVIIDDDYAHSFYVVPVGKDGVDGVVAEQGEYNDFDNENRRPNEYPKPSVDQNVHKITFNGNGGFVRTAYKNVKNGEAYGELSTAIKSGFKLAGWFTSASGGTEVTPEDIVNLSANQTLYAHWVSISHKVTLNAQGGKVSPTSLTVVDGDAFYQLPTPTYEGHVFEGWYTEAKGGNLITKETTVDLTGDITLYAHWEISYFIILEENGGEMDAINVKEVIVGKPYGELPVPTKAGYTFAGWFFEKSGTDAIQITEDSIVTEPKQHTLVAYWKGASYMISFDGNGVDITLPDKEVSVGLPYGELPSPTKTGYTFDGWFTEAEGGVKITATTKVTITNNHSLYAHWIKTPYEIIFDACGGVVNPAKKTVYFDNAPFGELPIPILPGCTFEGWFTQKAEGTEITAESVLLSEESITVYAHWDYKYSVVAPVVDVEEGSVKAGTCVNISSETVDAKIYYTTESAVGADLSENNGVLWEDAFEINENTTIYAVAVKPGFKNSDIVSWTYSVIDESEDWGDILEKDREGFASTQAVPKGIWVAGVNDTEYCGRAITFPDMHVYWGKKMMLEGKEYSLKYTKNINVGRAQIDITGKGDYTGKYSIFFNIIPRFLGDGVINNDRLMISDVSTDFTGKAQKKTTYVAYNLVADGEKDFYTELKAGRDFKYVYLADDDYKGVGEHKIEIAGIGNYEGKAYFTEIIENEKIVVSKLKVDSIPQQKAPLDGQSVEPVITVRNGKEVVPDEFYTVQYINNTKPGTATAIISGDGVTYSGTKKVTFKIAALPIKKASVVGLEGKIYSGNATLQTGYELTYQVKTGEEPEKLEENKDYTVRYVNHINAGKKAAIIFRGMGRFDGELTKYYEIKPYQLQDNQVVLPADMDAYSYQKNGTTPLPKVVVQGITLIKDKDYTVKYSDNKQVNDATGIKKPCMTITGKGNYAGTLTRTFAINLADLSLAKMSATDVVYANKSGICKSKLTLTDTNNVKLVAGTDYDKTNVVYTYVYDTYVLNGGAGVLRSGEVGGSIADVVDKGDIIPAGTAIRVTVYGIKNYAGSECSTIFRVVANDIAKAKVSVTGKVYTGNDILLTKDDITISYKGMPLEKTDYEIVGYNKNRNSGTAQVIIKGTGNFGGTKTVSFKIAKKPIPYVVSFDNNNNYMNTINPYAAKATGSMKDVQTQVGKNLPANGFKRTGYEFVGWNTKPDGSGYFYTNKEAFSIKNNPFAVMFFGHNITLYAQWEPMV